MLKPIKNWVFRNSIKKHPNVHFNKTEAVNSGDKILLLGNYEYKKEILEFAEYFQKAGRKAKVLLYTSKNVADDTHVYTDNDINWAGVPKSDIIEKRLSEKFDICIFLDTNYSPHYKYIVSLLMAEFVIGSDVDGLKEHFDLILDPKSKNINSYFEQVKIVLTKLSR